MKRIIIASAVLLIASVAFYFLKRNLGQTAKIGSKDFALAHPEQVDNFFYSAKNGQYLRFTKDENGMWWVQNDKKKYLADTASISFLLHDVMRKVEAKSPVNDAAKDNVIREMAISGVKVQFFNGKQELKTMYVGGRTNDDLGTYMHLPGAERPSVVKIPGRDGYLTPFFNTDINNWRTLVILDVPATDISALEVKWNEKPEDGFKIKKDGDELALYDHSGKAMPKINRNRIFAYLDMFSAISREAGEAAGINRSDKKDSLLRSAPFFQVAITRKNGKTEKLNIYRMAVSRETYTPETPDGVFKAYESDTYWATLEGSGEIWVMQDTVLKNRMKRLRDILGQDF